ncbi:MAG: RNA polymerase sigma factor [Verrucomicrobiae bacterium]|nr:RNA polymerase sigma factor [Verrucomicrobiae bacterium]
MNAQSMSETMDQPDLDARAVDAIQSGDRERYRELVERHSRRVYAVAWSRLGDPHLAEEAAQEAFIRGFRHLNYLRQGRKFATWITAIARNAATNLGLRHRRELEKRERWALEPSDPAAEATPATGSPGGRFTGDTLRNSLSQLPPVHRECLILFYLEEKSIAEAAAASSLSEGAFRTRLHRARTALREQLERELEQSLGKLRPPDQFVPGVMAILPAGSATPLAGAGLLGSLGSWASGLAAKLPFASLLPLLSMAFGLIPAFLFQRWLGREEQGNFRDPDGFRARQHRDSMRRMGWILPAVFGGIAIHQLVLTRIAGPRGLSLELAVVLSILSFSAQRTARLLGAQRAGLSALALLLVALGFWLTAFGVLPPTALGWFGLAAFIPMALETPHYSPRMDLSLFLRAHNDVLPELGCSQPPGRKCVTRPEQRAMAQFLGQRQLAVDFRWRGDQLDLRLAGIRFIQALPVPSLFWNRTSLLTLRADGSVRASLGTRDARALGRAGEAAVTALEQRVERATEAAWVALLTEGPAAAERWIGQQPESEVFKVVPRQSRAGKWRLRVIGIAIAMVALSQVLLWSLSQRNRHPPIPGFHLRPVDATPRELSATLALVATTPPPLPGQTNVTPGDPWLSFQSLIHYGALLPSRESLGDAWPVVRAALWETLIPTNTPPAARRDLLCSSLLLNPVVQRAFLSDWITRTELEQEGVNPAALRQWWRDANPALRRSIGGLAEHPVANSDHTILDVNKLAWRLRTLQAFELLDLFDAGPIVETLRAHQVLPGNTLAGRRPLSDREGLHGLFWIGFQGPLRDTHDVLVILSTLGALDRMDRTACIEGVLRLHRGQGLFGPVRMRPELFIPGDAPDTWAALESLRLLGGLDRVPDPGSWQFRPIVSTPQTSNGSPRQITHWEIEAWAMRESLKSGNPGAAGDP